MNQLSNKQLRDVLKKIDKNTNNKQLYTSKWHKTANFLYNNTGLSIAKIAIGGSLGKQTYYDDSDLDVIFCTPEELDHKEVLDWVEIKALECFGNVANEIKRTTNAVQIDYENPRCYIDIVYVTNSHFEREFKEIKRIRSAWTTQQNAIKIVKYVFSKILGEAIKGYELEQACLSLECPNLKTYVFSIVNYFRGRLSSYGKSMKNIFSYL